MWSFMKIEPLPNGKITLSFTGIGKLSPSREMAKYPAFTCIGKLNPSREFLMWKADFQTQLNYTLRKIPLVLEAVKM